MIPTCIILIVLPFVSNDSFCETFSINSIDNTNILWNNITPLCKSKDRDCLPASINMAPTFLWVVLVISFVVIKLLSPQNISYIRNLNLLNQICSPSLSLNFDIFCYVRPVHCWHDFDITSCQTWHHSWNTDNLIYLNHFSFIIANQVSLGLFLCGLFSGTVSLRCSENLLKIFENSHNLICDSHVAITHY